MKNYRKNTLKKSINNIVNWLMTNELQTNFMKFVKN